MESISNKEIVLICYRKIIRDLDLSLVDKYIREDYIQHSPTVKDGMAGLCEMLHFMKTLPRPTEVAPSPIIRIIAQSDFVAVHLDIRFMGKRAAIIDLFRLQDGMLAEHWDAGQGIGDDDVNMTNGTITINESVDARESKMIVQQYYNNDLSKADVYLSADYIEHNTASTLLNWPDSIKMHRLIAEGDLVFAQCEGVKSGKIFALYHIFRVETGKIAEHWSVEQEVPAVMAHGNGMF
ncbi:nuclear transport factor 2 family protein [Mucilaginibacter mallensis]|nr:nuclear transport factor 2 family protein [Mucilaginibacter mallensis]